MTKIRFITEMTIALRILCTLHTDLMDFPRSWFSQLTTYWDLQVYDRKPSTTNIKKAPVSVQHFCNFFLLSCHTIARIWSTEVIRSQSNCSSLIMADSHYSSFRATVLAQHSTYEHLIATQSDYSSHQEITIQVKRSMGVMSYGGWPIGDKQLC